MKDHEPDAYPEPPKRTPVTEKETALPNPALIGSKLFYYSVDLPVTKFREIIDSIRGRNKYYYYHQNFRRVPDLTECVEGDYLCYYEAEMQWRRDFKVDQEIVKIMQDRLRACHTREGPSYLQNCSKELQQFDEVAKAFDARYGDLGTNANSRRCLMKQKQRMLEQQQKA